MVGAALGAPLTAFCVPAEKLSAGAELGAPVRRAAPVPDADRVGAAEGALAATVDVPATTSAGDTAPALAFRAWLVPSAPTAGALEGLPWF